MIIINLNSVGHKYPLAPNVRFPTSYSPTNDEKYKVIYKDTYLFYHFSMPLTVWLDGKEYYTDDHACFFTKGVENHAFECKETNVHDWLHFRDDIMPLLNFFGLTLNKIYYPQQPYFISSILEELDRENSVSRDTPYSQMLINDKVEEFFIKFSREILRVKNEKESSIVYNSSRNWMSDIRKFMLSDLSHNWSINELSKKAMMSEPNFYRRYKEVFGISPKKDLILARIEQAQNLLITEKLKIEDVADKLGYSSTEHFIRQFQHYVGETPGKYSQRNLNHYNSGEKTGIFVQKISDINNFK